MTESKSIQRTLGKEGHFPNTSTAMLELYRLLTIFLSSKKFSSLLTNYPGEGFDPIYRLLEFESDEITRLLLNLAITARVIDDREDRIFELLGSSCGEYQKNINEPEIECLYLREACNKIMHASKVRSDIEKSGGVTHLNPYIYLHGKFNGKEWKVKLDIIAFAKEYVTLVSNF